jgi:hypothetical protein
VQQGTYISIAAPKTGTESNFFSVPGMIDDSTFYSTLQSTAQSQVSAQPPLSPREAALQRALLSPRIGFVQSSEITLSNILGDKILILL